VRRAILIAIDVLLVAFATVLAILLRDNIDIVQGKIQNLIPFVLITLGVASIVFLVGGLDRTLWRYSSAADHLQVLVLTALVVLITVVLTFAVTRLEGIGRSLPVLQAVLIVGVLVSARGAARIWFARQIHRKRGRHVARRPHETVLVAGVNVVSELFLRSVGELAPQQIQVAGILAEAPMLQGRAIQQKPVLGTIEDLHNVLGSLEVHGIVVDRIVVATAADRLSPRALDTLLEVEKSSDIVVHFLSERLGFEDPSRLPPVILGQEDANTAPGEPALASVPHVPSQVHHVNSPRKSFWTLKRIVDGLAAASLMIILSPLAALVVLVVALDVGFPLIFWQQRPGLYGRPFKLYKFRTMSAAHDKHSKRVPDEQRLSAVGRLLRHTRLDELPQLYNVLIGDMSFVGPRPLLPRDQSPDYVARLSVRPGITGWAQVNGGRIVTPRDKAILDIWYVTKASFVLDIKIVLRTIKMVLFGDRINVEAVHQARRDLNQFPAMRGLLWVEMASPAE
jgi:lipopolysaccharide/colanic/teichoic acid biosynthesis glycosyltransferase